MFVIGFEFYNKLLYLIEVGFYATVYVIIF